MTTTLVTGAAGSLGSEIVDILIKRGHKVVAFDNSETGLFHLIYKNYPANQFSYVYGSVRDYHRIHYAMRGCDVVVHAAAMKNLEITEHDISEMTQTNTVGSDNVAWAAEECGVECAILISTDKVVNSHSAYGAGKLLAEEIWKGRARQTTFARFVIFRSGNFKQSAGNVLEVCSGRRRRARC
jgi:UDP-N-acetylglucosamine 4,6-dehydratase/5-epimerase